MSIVDEDKEGLEGRLTRLEAGQARLEAGLAKLEAGLAKLTTGLAKLATVEAVRDVETALLTEFHKWSSPVEMRIRTHASAMRPLDLQIEAIADRVTRLEEKI
jgi:X-X-X-Leu-X-X-Gly heptad repeat protein